MNKHTCSLFYLAPSFVLVLGCPKEDDGPPDLEACGATEGDPIEGNWDGEVEDWHDPGPDGNDVLSAADACGHGVLMNAHHCFTTAVHAIHTHTGHVFTMHGEYDQRMWEIGTPEDQITWHPIPFRNTFQNLIENDEGDPAICGGASWCYEDETGWPDVFCAGHVQLSDGRLYLAGGNVTGQGAGGGLFDTFLFDPEAMAPASATTCPFGWAIGADGNGVYNQNQPPQMEHDRWYPTLTVLPDGRVLIASGYSRQTPDEDGFALRTRLLEVYNPADNTMVSLNSEEGHPNAMFPDAASKFPDYPAMFLLPNGDIFYAGSEEADNPTEAAGRILIPDYNNGGTWEWSNHVIASSTSGGSSAMYAPGKILKTGGPNFSDNQTATNIAEVVDLSSYSSNDYGSAPTEFSLADAMAHARHYHNLTVLPDGRVIAVGGNRFGNSEGVDHFNNPCRDPTQGNQLLKDLAASGGCYTECIEWNPNQLLCDGGQPPPSNLRCSLLNAIDCEDDMDCDAAMSGATCLSGGTCFKACTTEGSDPACTPIQGNAVTSPLDPDNCWPHSNECEASYTAEVWDPECNRWEELGDQVYPRMYHSTALLMPDGRVLSMGGGHRDFGSWRNLREGVIGEYFEPTYGNGGARPSFTIGASSAPNAEGPYLPWDGSVEVVMDAGSVPPASATLVRLGSTTHGFDMDQRFIRLGPLSGMDSSFTIPGPVSGGGDFSANNIAPPGYYMLFLFSGAGQPSIGQYIRVGGQTPSMLLCEASASLAAFEDSCTDEPASGACPAPAQHTESVALPQVTGLSGTVEGFHVLVPPGMVENPALLTAGEQIAVETLCSQACEAHFTGPPGQRANCSDPGVFEAPVFLAEASQPLDLLRSDARQGEGLFAGQQLSCDLGMTCYTEFDEALAPVVPRRVTPAEDMLAVGEEFRVALGGRSEVALVTNQGTYTSRLSGSVGYGFCLDGTGPCPFYFSSMEAVAGSDIFATATCDDGTLERLTLENLVVGLGQPAFGIADATSDLKAFPGGGLMLDSSFSVEGVLYGARRPNRLPVTVDVRNEAFTTTGLESTIVIPCATTSRTVVTVRLDLEDPGDGSAIARPPQVSITTPAIVTCGVPSALTATASDADDDLATVRWFVDDVLIAPGTSTINFTQSHTLKAIAYDTRGAATTDTKVIQCL